MEQFFKDNDDIKKTIMEFNIKLIPKFWIKDRINIDFDKSKDIVKKYNNISAYFDIDAIKNGFETKDDKYYIIIEKFKFDSNDTSPWWSKIINPLNDTKIFIVDDALIRIEPDYSPKPKIIRNFNDFKNK